MKIRKLLFRLLLGGALAGSLHAATPKLIVAILVDQLRYDYLERFADQFTTNGFKQFTEHGVFLTFARYDYCPTITGPGHASFFSGSTPSVHGIIGNDWFDKRTRKSVYCVDDLSVEGVGTASTNSRMSPRNFIGATFADQLRLQYGASKVVGISMKDRGAILPAGKKPLGAYWFETKSGNFVTSSYYRPELPEWVKRFNEEGRAAGYMGKTWEAGREGGAFASTAAGPPDEGSKPLFSHKLTASKQNGFDSIMPTPFGNELLADFARAAIQGEHLGEGTGPDLLCVSFSSIDYCGHKYGPDAPEMRDITLRFDRQLAGLFSYLERTIGLTNVVMALTSDHGVAPTPEFAAEQGLAGQRVNLGEVFTNLTSRLTEKFGAGKYFLAQKFYDGNLYFDDDTLAEKKLPAAELASFIREWALATGKFQAVYSREQLLDGRAPGLVGRLVMNGYNAERSGDVVLILKPFAIASTAKTGSTHGSPYTYDTHVPVLFFGAPFQPGRYADEFYITDLVPTLCAALHVDEPPGCMGRPFVKALLAQ